MKSREISFPFHIGPEGGVAYETDPYRIYFQHLVSIILTRPEERVMLPTYGTSTEGYLFENLEEASSVELTVQIRQALAQWEPAVVVHEVTPSLEGWADGQLRITITFSIPPRLDVLTTTVNVGALTGESNG